MVKVQVEFVKEILSLIGWVSKSIQMKIGQAYNLALIWLESKISSPVAKCYS